MKSEKLQSKIKKCFLIKILVKARIFLLFVICYLLFAKPAFAQYKTFFGDVAGICEYWKEVFDFSVGAAGILAVLTLMLGGLYYLISVGDKEKIGKAKEVMSAGIAGFLLILLGWTIFNAVAPQLNQCKIEVEYIKLKGKDVTELSEIEVSGGVPETDFCTGVPLEKLFASEIECKSRGGKDGSACDGECFESRQTAAGKWCCQQRNGCVKNPVYYSQTQPQPWALKLFGKGCSSGKHTMNYVGCGPTALAMALSTFGINKNPSQVADEVIAGGWERCGMSWDAVPGVLRKYGLNVRTVDIEGAKRALLAGEAVVAIAHGPQKNPKATGAFTDGGHFIFIHCYNENTRRFSVYSSSKRGTGDYDEAVIRSDVVGFWAVNKSSQ
jgi:hypothetical protein